MLRVAAGRARRHCRRGCRCAPTSTGRAPTGGASSCACSVNASGGLDLFPNQSSGVLTSAVWADGLVDNPPGQAIGRGDTVRFLPLAELIAR